MNRELGRIGNGEAPALDADTGALVALYARTLSTIDREHRKGGKPGELASKTTEELAEMALQDPYLRDLLKGVA